MRIIWLIAATLMLVAPGSVAHAADDPTAVKSEDGKYLDKEGTPTFKVAADGTVDWYTYSGFRRYHSECHVCHGPDGMGSTYAPALKDSLKTMSYGDFLGVVASGRKSVNTAGSCQPSATIRMSPATWTTFMSICVPGRMTPSGACGLPRVKTNPTPTPRQKSPAWEANDRAEHARCPSRYVRAAT